MSERLEVPKKVNSSENNVNATRRDVVIMPEKIMSDDYRTAVLECEVSDEVLGNVDASSLSVTMGLMFLVEM